MVAIRGVIVERTLARMPLRRYDASVSTLGRIDVHCHLLPNADDGCTSIEESVICAKRFVEAGYTHVFCTPHIWPNLEQNTMENITRWTANLQEEITRRHIPLTLLPGGEINLTPTYRNTPERDVVSYRGARKFVIFDIWADKLPPHFEPSVKWLQRMGLTVILAHPERMRAVQDDPLLADYFASIGLLLQGNLQCFGDPPHTDTRRVAELFLREDRYFCLGSDCHGPKSMDVRMRGLVNAIELAGEAVIDRLTKENPRQLL